MALKIKDIAYSYGSHPALKGVSYSFEKGIITGIIGPNGSGKTTLLHSLNGILSAEGEIILDRLNIKQMKRKEIARYISFVSQKEDINFPFTVYEILLMGRYPHLPLTKSLNAKDYLVVDAIIKELDIADLKDRSVDKLSGGEFQKVMIARALVQEPRVLLLDEPTLHLDLNHQFEILNFIHKICIENDLIVIMVSHDLLLTGKYCDQCLILYEGLLDDGGMTSDVLTPSSIKRIYNIDAEVRPGDDNGRVTVIPKDIAVKNEQQTNPGVLT